MRTGFPDAVKGAAANALLNRGWGMPRQAFEAVVKSIDQMSLAEVEAEFPPRALEFDSPHPSSSTTRSLGGAGGSKAPQAAA